MAQAVNQNQRKTLRKSLCIGTLALTLRSLA
jgi:hypothetical protein